MDNTRLRKLLLKLGISPNVQSYFFIIDCIEILHKQKIHINVTTLYGMVGKKYGKTGLTVERCMRNLRDKMWEKGALKVVYTSKPDNSQFLYDLYFNFDILEEELDKFIQKGEL